MNKPLPHYRLFFRTIVLNTATATTYSERILDIMLQAKQQQQGLLSIPQPDGATELFYYKLPYPILQKT